MCTATAGLREKAPHWSWTAEQKLHLTLKFLGEQPPDVAQRLADAMDGVARRHGGFDMRVRRVGAFPNFRRARVVWLGVDPDPRLELLHHDVETACDALGFELEGKPFRPHVTLARLRARPAEDAMRVFARAARRVAFDERITVESIDLMESRTGPDGSTYERLHASRLRSR